MRRLFMSLCLSLARCVVTLGGVVNRPTHTNTTTTTTTDSICRSWDVFERCVSGVISGCSGNAWELWESLKVESRKTQCSGNLYEMCGSRALTSPRTPPTTDRTNQESLKGGGVSSVHAHSVFLACVFCDLIGFI